MVWAARCGKWANEQLQEKAKHGALENACNGFDHRWSYYAAATAAVPAPLLLPLFSSTSTTRLEAEDVQGLDSKEREREFTHSYRQEGASLRYAYCRARSFLFSSSFT